MDGTGDADPYDDRVSFRGSGRVVIEGDGLAKLYGKPRLYVDKGSDEGWMNVVLTGYAKFVNDGTELSPFSGFTMAARSSHDEYGDNGCSAFGYYAQIRKATGECLSLKDYFHSNSGGGTVYSDAIRVDCMQPYNDQIPLDQWIGMKFMVLTPANSPDKVYLKLYLDYAGDGTAWTLVHEFVDEAGKIPTSAEGALPTYCDQNNGDPNLRPGNVCFLRTDGSPDTEVHWKDVSFVDQDNHRAYCQVGIPSADNQVCCDIECGVCDDSSSTSAECNAGIIATHGPDCADEFDTSCRGNPTSATGPTTTSAMYTGPFCLAGIQLSKACCAAECGTCGGSGCSKREGGAENCCYGTVLTQGFCQDALDVGCEIPEVPTTTSTLATSSNDGNSASGAGGDPHFQRWGQTRESFHGECDLVLVHSEGFQNGIGFDMHARTTVQSFYSYIESAALQIGLHNIQVEQSGITINKTYHEYLDLPVAFGVGSNTYTITLLQQSSVVKKFCLDLQRGSTVVFKFYKHFLTISISGSYADFGDATGLLGRYGTGDMYNREGNLIDNFGEFAFDWQVNPMVDAQVFAQSRSPHLPFEQCRLPTEARPARRHLLRGNPELLQQAQGACTDALLSGHDWDLCVHDIMSTGDLGMVQAW